MPSWSFNPRSPCGERRRRALGAVLLCVVSTHAPLAGSDMPPMRPLRLPICFNPRSPCGERHCPSPPTAHRSRFNPRSPCGERQSVCHIIPGLRQFQPTLPLRGATPGKIVADIDAGVSTHVPLAGSDLRVYRGGRLPAMFQPTLPLRGATAAVGVGVPVLAVSTHAPLAGSDRRRPW